MGSCAECWLNGCSAPPRHWLASKSRAERKNDVMLHCEQSPFFLGKISFEVSTVVVGHYLLMPLVAASRVFAAFFWSAVFFGLFEQEATERTETGKTTAFLCSFSCILFQGFG